VGHFLMGLLAFSFNWFSLNRSTHLITKPETWTSPKAKAQDSPLQTAAGHVFLKA